MAHGLNFIALVHQLRLHLLRRDTVGHLRRESRAVRQGRLRLLVELWLRYAHGPLEALMDVSFYACFHDALQGSVFEIMNVVFEVGRQILRRVFEGALDHRVRLVCEGSWRFDFALAWKDLEARRR